MSDKISRASASIILLLVVSLLLLWEISARANPGVMFFAASPTAIIRSLTTMIARESFHQHFLLTGSEAFAGLVLGSFFGSVAGLALWYYRSAASILTPLLLAIGSVPILAFGPLMIVWFGVGVTLKVALAALMTFFVAFSQATEGARSVSSEHIEVLCAMGAKRKQLFWMAIVPGSLDWVLRSMRLNVGFSLMGAFVGEFIASDAGLGHVVLRSSSLYDMPRALAACVGIVVLAVVFDRAAALLVARHEYIARVLSVPGAILSPVGPAKRWSWKGIGQLFGR